MYQGTEWQSKMEVKSIPNELGASNQDEYDAEDASSGSKELAEGGERRAVRRRRHAATVRQ